MQPWTSSLGCWRNVTIRCLGTAYLNTAGKGYMNPLIAVMVPLIIPIVAGAVRMMAAPRTSILHPAMTTKTHYCHWRHTFQVRLISCRVASVSLLQTKIRTPFFLNLPFWTFLSCLGGSVAGLFYSFVFYP